VPAIVAKETKAAGAIILAGATRPIEDSIVSQTRYLATLDWQVTDDEAKQIAQFEQLARSIRAVRKPSDPAPQAGPFSPPTSYWLALSEVAPQKFAPSLRAPTLVLQGERDYQITMQDFAE
jgi:uncharacterized protein